MIITDNIRSLGGMTMATRRRRAKEERKWKKGEKLTWQIFLRNWFHETTQQEEPLGGWGTEGDEAGGDQGEALGKFLKNICVYSCVYVISVCNKCILYL